MLAMCRSTEHGLLCV